MGRSPKEIEDQITYPISSTLLAIPFVPVFYVLIRAWVEPRRNPNPTPPLTGHATTATSTSLLVIGVVAALLLARTRWGWAAAVTLSVLAPPRLFLYAFSTLISTLGRPSGEVTRATGPTDALPDPLDRLGQ